MCMSLLRSIIPNASSAILQSDQSHHVTRQATQQQIVQQAVTSGQAVVVSLASNQSGKNRGVSHGKFRQVDSPFAKEDVTDPKEEKKGKTKTAPTVNVSA
jgi:hypothetical protein